MRAYGEKLTQQRVARNLYLKENGDLKKIKSGLDTSSNTIKMEGYYMNKAPDFDIFTRHNPQITKEPMEYHKQKNAFIDLVKIQTEQMAIHKNRLVPFSQVVSGKIVAKTGSTIIREDTGDEIQEFEWSSKSLNNECCALQRHVSPMQEPHPDFLVDFDAFCDNTIGQITDEILEKRPTPQFLMMDYPSGQDQWSD